MEGDVLILKESIGKQSNKVKNRVDRGMVKRFAEAIGDPHSNFIDEDTGKQSRYGNNIAPPTFPQVFDYGEIFGLDLPGKGLIHGEQTYHYKRPLLVGEEIHCFTVVKDYYEKEGKHGAMGFLVINKQGEDTTGKNIFTAEQVVIITGAVRKVMEP